MQYIAGIQEVINNLRLKESAKLTKIAAAVEQTCADVRNHAKSGHERNQGHMNKRYENQTNTLTSSITSGLAKVTDSEVTGIVSSNVEYAAAVEFGTSKSAAYPYMFPALVANKENYKNKLKQAL